MYAATISCCVGTGCPRTSLTADEAQLRTAASLRTTVEVSRSRASCAVRLGALVGGPTGNRVRGRRLLVAPAFSAWTSLTNAVAPPSSFVTAATWRASCQRHPA